MRESGYYPMGAEHDPHAPWNEYENAPVDKECTYMCTMTKGATVTTTDYQCGYVDKEWDGESWIEDRCDDDFSDTNWENAWEENHETPQSLINELKYIAQCCLDGNPPKKSTRQWKYLLQECEGWEQDDVEIELD